MSRIKNIYLISYFGNEINKINTRKKLIISQFDWLSKKKDINIRVIAQEWPEDFKASFIERFSKNLNEVGSSLELIEKNKMRPGAARNINIEHFYSSDEDYALFLDDDVLSYCCIEKKKMPEYDVFEFFERNLINIDFDIINFKNYRFRSGVMCCDHHMKATTEFSGGVFIIRNLKKHHFLDLRFKEDIPMLEDMMFGMEAVYNGLKLYLCENPYIFELSSISVLSSGEEERKIINFTARKYMFNFWMKELKFDIVKLRNNRLYQNDFKNTFMKYNSFCMKDER
jgi:hypothetical protein